MGLQLSSLDIKGSLLMVNGENLIGEYRCSTGREKYNDSYLNNGVEEVEYISEDSPVLGAGDNDFHQPTFLTASSKTEVSSNHEVLKTRSRRTVVCHYDTQRIENKNHNWKLSLTVNQGFNENWSNSRM
ncbi:uncharacterized protein LOC123674637 [Harmonia axyridis]|uniref:uncharacterized protein LOC123674637 n=1 Tax=Harmonia axyridis TaxID=115357 RepID=UPI001E2794C6|nr:uncharacterized protein LOC123674637 [Harmonia axyridis]